MSALKRGAAMRALYKQGHATSKQLLEAEYGVWPPKGVDYTAKNKLDTNVNIKSHFADKEMGFFGKAFTTVAALGYVHGKETAVGSEDNKKAPKDQTIYMNKALFSPLGKVAMAYLAFNFAAHFLAEAAATGVMSYFTNHWFMSANLFMTSVRHQMLVQMVTMPFRGVSDTLGHEHIHILQIHDQKRAKTGHAMDDDYFKNQIVANHKEFTGLRKVAKYADNFFSLGMSRYFLNDVEVQARMHTALVHGYQRWGRLPQTQTELHAAMIDAGLNAPQEIWDTVKNSREKGVADFETPGFKGVFNRVARKMFSMEAVELNVSQRAISDEPMRLKFWQTTMPFMYGHLLELYGDESGFEKMGINFISDQQKPEEELKQARVFRSPWASPPPPPEYRPSV